MPAYNENRLAAVFFVTFLLIGFFFLLNFVLAMVSHLYSEQVMCPLQLQIALCGLQSLVNSQQYTCQYNSAQRTHSKDSIDDAVCCR